MCIRDRGSTTIRADERNANKAIIQRLNARDDNTVYTKAYILSLIHI